MPRKKRTAAAGFPPPDSQRYYLGTEYVEGLPAVGELRRKRCYELVSHALAVGNAPLGSLAVHGSIDGGADTLGRIGHAWLRMPGGLVWEPIAARVYDYDEWAEWAQAEPEVAYGKKDLLVQMLKSGHMGPWHQPHSYRQVSEGERAAIREGGAREA